VCNPADDGQFVSSATSLATNGTSISAFEIDLRALYPHAIVHEGTSTADGQRWYAYRDGRWAGATSHLVLVDLG